MDRSKVFNARNLIKLLKRASASYHKFNQHTADWRGLKVSSGGVLKEITVHFGIIIGFLVAENDSCSIERNYRGR